MSISILPSAARLAALGLATAGLTILALAFLVVSDLAREADLHREVIAVQQAQDSLELLRVRMNELVAAARLAAATGRPDALSTMERSSADIDARLAALRGEESLAAVVDAVDPQMRLLMLDARSIAPARLAHDEARAAKALGQTESAAAEAGLALERAIAALTTRVNGRTLDQIRVGESLRRYVAWFVAGSIAVLGGLFVAFRRVQARERAARQRIEWLAHYDAVTGLPNRALLSDRLAQETARARRGASRFAVVLFDLDGFKEVNDTWGHAAGDGVLATVAERARKCMRASDTVGRVGGDEFMAILPEASAEGAHHVADKLRRALSEPYALEQGIARVGASLGVSFFPDHGEDAEALLQAADAALYRAKREGKDRVCVAEDAPRPRMRAAEA